MLSNDSKSLLTYGISTLIAQWGLERTIAIESPAWHVGECIRVAASRPEQRLNTIAQDLAENREEAEKHVAGLLGMM